MCAGFGGNARHIGGPHHRGRHDCDGGWRGGKELATDRRNAAPHCRPPKLGPHPQKNAERQASPNMSKQRTLTNAKVSCLIGAIMVKRSDRKSRHRLQLLRSCSCVAGIASRHGNTGLFWGCMSLPMARNRATHFSRESADAHWCPRRTTPTAQLVQTSVAPTAEVPFLTTPLDNLS